MSFPIETVCAGLLAVSQSQVDLVVHAGTQLTSGEWAAKFSTLDTGRHIALVMESQIEEVRDIISQTSWDDLVDPLTAVEEAISISKRENK